MIYFDNAATTAVKPPEVAEAVARAVNSFGGVGRGVHEASLDAGYAVFRARQQLARLFGAADPSCVSFASNATEALNTAIAGLARPGDKLVTTAASHNSVLRPLYRLADERGCEVVVVPHDARGALDYDALEAALPGARLAAVTHASNLTGDVYDIARIARLCRDRGALLVADAAQTAGVVPIDMGRDGLDVVAFTGHKSLYGPQGTGLLLCGAEGKPLLYGGTGSMSRLQDMPPDLPDRLEPGTHNMPGIAGLLEGIRFVRRQGVETIAARERQVALRAARGLESLPGVRVFWDRELRHQTGVVSFVTEGRDCEAVGEALARRGIALRAGLHCAPLAHRTAGTLETGTLRLSTSFFNTPDQADRLVWAVSRVLRENVEL
mgnify:CR=1 FL=1